MKELPAMGAFLLWAHRRDLNLRRSERKENAERFSELASPPAIRFSDPGQDFRLAETPRAKYGKYEYCHKGGCISESHFCNCYATDVR